MITGNEPAMPLINTWQNYRGAQSNGLTVRQYFAIHIHAALVAKGSYGYHEENAKQAVKEADALINELNLQNGKV